MADRETLDVLDVGHGSCAIVRGVHDTVLIDAGPGSAVLEYLTEQGISRVSTVLLSHADSDHIRGLIALLGSGIVEISNVRLNSDALKDSSSWEALLYELDEADRAGRLSFETSVTEGDIIGFESADVVLKVLAPRKFLAARGPGSRDRDDDPIDTNTISAVVRVEIEGTPIALLTGDLDAVGLKHLQATTQDLAAPVLVFPHHGGRAGRDADREDNAQFASELCTAVQPKDVVFSTGRGRYATPRPEVMEAVRASNLEARIACTQLSEHCAGELLPRNPSHLLPLYAAGRVKRSCCAGTLSVDLGRSAGRVLPAEGHQVFVDANAPTALCRRRGDVVVAENP